MSNRPRIPIPIWICLAIVTAGSILSLWIRLDTARTQEAAVFEVERIGGAIGYLHEWDKANDHVSNASVPGPAWVRNFTGDHFFLLPDIVLFDEYQGSAAELSCVSKLKTINQLSITHGPHVGDAFVDTLLELPNLKVINLYGTSISLGALCRLKALQKLKTLSVSHTLDSAEDAESLRVALGSVEVLWNNDPYVRSSELLEDAEPGT